MRGGGAPFNTASPLPAIGLMLAYAASLLFGVSRKHVSYRLAMAAAPLMAGGGVLMNILNYTRTGLEGYSSFGAWVIGTAINTDGLIWNIVAAAGWHRREGQA